MPCFPHVDAVSHAPADEMHEHLMDGDVWDGVAEASCLARHSASLSSIRLRGPSTGRAWAALRGQHLEPSGFGKGMTDDYEGRLVEVHDPLLWRVSVGRIVRGVRIWGLAIP